jgi:hypothetical protein
MRTAERGSDGKRRCALPTLTEQNRWKIAHDLDVVESTERTHDPGCHAAFAMTRRSGLGFGFIGIESSSRKEHQSANARKAD